MTLDHLTIMLPWPDKELFPNRKARGSFRRHQTQREAARHSGFYATKEALGRNEITLGARNHVNLIFGYPNRIKRDLDGCIGAVKHYLDGIAKALGVDDQIFRPLFVDDCLDTEKRGFVRIDIFSGDKDGKQSI